jgi:integrase
VIGHVARSGGDRFAFISLHPYGDIDSAQSIIRIVPAKGRKDRHVMLSPETLDLLRQWWKVRPTRYGRPRAVTPVPTFGLADVDRGPRDRPTPVLRRERNAR